MCALLSDRTYDFIVVHPGPNLNMIVGANGTGKSSIVCAICLGLAGKTSLLGRGDKVGIYVKNGCSKGYIEIELYKIGGNVVIKREIIRETNQSHWMLNGKQCNQKTVEEEVKALRIQVSNLCQFLPQEKVGEFAKMSKIELLEATEKSVGPPEMYEYHCELKNFRIKERELENALKEKDSFLEKAKQRHERNKYDVNRYYEKKRHLDVIELLEKKKPWVEYETTRKELEAVKKEREEAKKRLSVLKQAQAPLIRKIQLIEDQLKPTDAQIKVKVPHTTIDPHDYFIIGIKQALRLKEEEEKEHQKRISNTKRIIDGLKADLSKVGDQPDVAEQISSINAELRRIQEDRAKLDDKADLRREKDNLNAQNFSFLNDMDNTIHVKEDKLRSRHKDTYTAVQWLRQNKHLFKGNVYEPMMLVINMKDSQFAKYVETHISFHDLRAFVFQRKDDMEKFMTEVRDNQNLRVNSICAPEASFAKQPSSRHIESLRRFGFFSYLREMFDAPEEVMSYLCQQYKVHDVPVGDNRTKTMIKTVIEEPYIRILYTTDERYTVKKSLYSNKVSTSNSAVQPSQYLIINVDAEEKRQLEQQLEVRDSRQTLSAASLLDFFYEVLKHFLDHHENKLLVEKKRLSELKGKRRQLEQKIRTKEDSLKQMEQNVIDMKKVEEDTKKKVDAVHSQKVAIVTALMAQMKVRIIITVPLKWVNQCFDVFLEVKQTFLKCVYGLSLQAFTKLPDTPDEIDAMLNEERSKADCFTGLNENVVSEYNKREQEIKHLEKEQEERVTALNTYRQNISQAKERWLNPLKQLVEQINEKFSEFFRSMQCAGEVDLHSDNEEEYDKFGIRIRVKFHRSTHLHELTAHHQSGGERSVSTMLYLMALQELNRCPFRVVDEINQGMDPINERRVFDIVVSTACKKTTSQYFFITPKLLQNLKYDEKMTVLCVHNGIHMLTSNQWDTKAFIQRRLNFTFF
uniref:Structural maintenance of chromosomes protein 5 n=1 Tax=Gouania willdenowi TaxID=441366 RepID=A0A8C5HIJ4_GOUWI